LRRYISENAGENFLRPEGIKTGWGMNTKADQSCAYEFLFSVPKNQTGSTFINHGVKRVLFKFIRWSGLPFLFREIFQRSKITILLFHDIETKTARKAFSYLSKKYNIISLHDFVSTAKGINNYIIPHKALIITFDDGYRGNYKLLRTIQEYRIPVTIFLCAGIVNTNRRYWFTCNQQGISIAELKRISNKKKLDILNQAGFPLTRSYGYTQSLNKRQIWEMKNDVDFQSHTLFHPCLSQCDDEEARNEISKSKEILKSEYGLPIYAIAYPDGDYSDRDIKLCKEAGYSCGITVDYGFNSLKTDLFKLKRLSVNDTDNMDELVVRTSGVWDFLKKSFLAIRKSFIGKG
jgi:peptidoglycan/xylan/chitin deacetylase (PgdA/CDA1 family)